MFVGNASVFAPLYRPCCVFILGASRFVPVSLRQRRSHSRSGVATGAAAFKNFDRIENQARQKCRRATRDFCCKATWPSPLECALAKKGGRGVPCFGFNHATARPPAWRPRTVHAVA